MKIITLLCLLSLLLLSVVVVVSVSALRFGIIGDWGMGGRKTPWDQEIRSAAAYNEACEKFFAEGFCNLTLSVGDNIYTSDVGMGLQESFGLFSRNTGPFFLVTGNHDNFGPQFEYAKRNNRWKWPSRYHDFKVPIDDSGRDGHTVHFFALDSMDGSLREGGEQYRWLEEKLSTCNSRWKIFFAHYPVTGAGRHRREGSVTSISKLMDKYNVQVFFCGHDHILDVNMMQGKVMPISGAMARGGMMLRGIAGAAHQFTLTQPGEFNENKVDWPGHGFFTAEMSANILTVHAWDHFGGIMYSFQVTHDWVAKVHKMPSAMENKFPPAAEIRAAALAERDLPRGPGGGKFYTLDGEEIDAPKYFEGTNNNQQQQATAPGGETKARLTEKPMDTSYTKFKDEVPVTIPTRIDNPNFITSVAPEERAKNTERETVAKYVRYTVSSECMNCERDIYANESFSIFVVGMDLTSKSRMFLSESKIGCAMSKYFPKRVEGTSIIQPSGNQAVFTAFKATNPTFVCLSLDAGKTYMLLKRIDDLVNVDGFIIRQVRTESEKKPGGSRSSSNNNHNNNNGLLQTSVPLAPPSSPSSSDGDTNTNQVDGSSIGQYLVIIGVALLVGVAISALSKSQFFEELTNPHHHLPSSTTQRERLPTNNNDNHENENESSRRNTAVVDE